MSKPQTEYFVDNEPQTTTEKELKVRVILENAGFDPNTHYLVELPTQKQYKNLDEDVPIHEKEKFAAIFTGPTPVSDLQVPNAVGPAKLAGELMKRGFRVEVRQDFVIISDFEIPVGRFAGQKIQLAFQCPGDYEITPPGGFHTSPQLIAPGTNNVHQSPMGPSFSYWSRPIHEWPKQRNAARLISNVNAVFLVA